MNADACHGAASMSSYAPMSLCGGQDATQAMRWMMRISRLSRCYWTVLPAQGDRSAGVRTTVPPFYPFLCVTHGRRTRAWCGDGAIHEAEETATEPEKNIRPAGPRRKRQKCNNAPENQSGTGRASQPPFRAFCAHPLQSGPHLGRQPPMPHLRLSVDS